MDSNNHDGFSTSFDFQDQNTNFNPYSDPINRERPKLEELQEVKNECKNCQKCFSGPFALRRHQKSCKGSEHSVKKTNRCETCQKIFSTPFALIRHQKSCKGTIENSRKAINECEKCQKYFSRPFALIRHQKSCKGSEHSRKATNECEKCQKLFSRPFGLVRHKKSCKGTEHSTKAVNECEKCMRIFSRPFALKRHQRLCKGTEHSTNATNECEKCQKIFSRPYALRRHHKLCKGTNNSQNAKNECEKCQKSFSGLFAFRRHQKSCTGGHRHLCPVCGITLESSQKLEKHMRLKHSNRCPRCGKLFYNKDFLSRHARRHLNNDYLTINQARVLRRLAGSSYIVPLPKAATSRQSKVPRPSSSTSSPSQSLPNTQSLPSHQSPPDDQVPDFEQTVKQIHGGAGVLITMIPSGIEKHSMLDAFKERRSQFRWNLSEYLNRWNNTRWYITVIAKMLRFDTEGNIRDEDRPSFRSRAQVLLDSSETEDQIDKAYFKINASLENYCSVASGWVLDKILVIEQTILRYRPLGGDCGDFTLPRELKNRGLVSVNGRPTQSRDCFIWAVTAAIHGDPENIGQYIHWTELQEQRKLYSLTETMKENCTVTTSQIPDFEILNKVSINLFTFEDSAFPLYVSKNTGIRGHANLLLVHSEDEDADDGVRRHYCAITDLGKLVYRQLPRGCKVYVCPRCLTPKGSSDDLERHTELCRNHDPLCVSMPDYKKRFLRFRNYHLQLEAPFVIVARFESFRMPIYDRDEPTEGVTVRERAHRPCAFAYHRVSVDDSYPSDPVSFADPDPEIVMKEFLRQMQSEQEQALNIMKEVRPKVLCDEGVRNIQASNERCHICDDPFVPGTKVVEDHDHVSGKIRGRACNACNLNFRCPNHIIVLLHDLSSYDGRIIMTAASLYGASQIKVVPRTIDTYVGITIDKCRFIDFQNFFKGASLGALVEDLYGEAGLESFPNTRAHWPSFALPVPLRRVPLCRDYIDGPERLLETNFPSIEAFHDTIQGSDLTPDQYETAVNAWNLLDGPCLLDYLKFALITDCLYTSDVVSHFRKTVREHLKLDPLRYYSLASFAFDSALRFSETSLELPTDVEMHLMIENAIRGGLALVGSPRMATANHPDVPQYNPELERSNIDFFDFNGLYMSTMMNCRLPAYGFRFLDETEIESLSIMDVPENADHGFILEVDLAYPEEVHDKHDDFPMAPEHIEIKKEQLSKYTRETAERCGIDLDNISSQRRLCLTLKDKVKYTVHYRALQFYVTHGLRLTKIHRVIRFCQVPFLQSFMTYCSEERKKAKSPMYKSVWKNIANLVSGKTYENPRNYSDVRICTDQTTLMRYVSRPTFNYLRVFGDNLTAVQLHRQVVTLNKPITVGFAILELSKLFVYKFYYESVKPVLARGGRCNFLAGDTDSLVVQITGVPDLQERYKKNSHLFDFSNLPEDHHLKSDRNRMVPGKIKLETKGDVCIEFLGLTPKTYSLKTDKGFKQARKGCSRELRHELYRECLLSGSCYNTNVKEMRNYGQDLYQVSVRKRVLSVLDVKRHHYNAIESVSFGHYSLEV